MITPMQELIEQLKELQETYTQFADSYTAYTLHNVIELAESMLEKEEKVIKDAVKYGCSDWGSAKDAEEYYNKTFKTKER